MKIIQIKCGSDTKRYLIPDKAYPRVCAMRHYCGQQRYDVELYSDGERGNSQLFGMCEMLGRVLNIGATSLFNYMMK